jgi:hypothetical protein
MMYESTAGITNSYRLLLGDKVVNEMEARIGQANAKKFLKLHAKYDTLVRKSPKSDPMQAMNPNDFIEVEGFDDYLRFLGNVEAQLRGMKEPISQQLHSYIKSMLVIGNTKLKTKPSAKAHATAGVSGMDAGMIQKANPNSPMQNTPPLSYGSKPVDVDPTAHYRSKMFQGRSLPSVPLSMIQSETLPYSYPSFNATYDVVQRYAGEHGYVDRVRSELTATMKRGIKKILEHESHAKTFEPKDIAGLVVEAQEFLMNRNWIRYNINNVATASHSLALAGIRHRVNTKGMISHIENNRTCAYAYLGMSLENVLRRGVFALAKDLLQNTDFAGKQAALDVVIACSSLVVQNSARSWLSSVQSYISYGD